LGTPPLADDFEGEVRISRWALSRIGPLSQSRLLARLRGTFASRRQRLLAAFRSDDAAHVQPIREAFLARGLNVFWSNDIAKGVPNYQEVIKKKLLEGLVVVVVWTNASVHSGPVSQECSQAGRLNKLFQILLDDIEPHGSSV
jgi:hypothetical protein